MITFLNNFYPEKIILSFGFISLKWYGLLIVLGILAALIISIYLGKKYFKIENNKIFDLAFWLIIIGLIGARIYDVFLFLPYYTSNPLQVFQIWKGGMAIHGGIIAGLIVIYFFAKNNNINYFKLSSLIAPGIALGQSIGRWGNYFNQELFGRPTNFVLKIPISTANRPAQYLSENYFHPTFLYESIGSFIIFLFLIFLYKYIYRKNGFNNYFFVWSSALYMILYSVLRFSTEFIRIDQTPEVLGLRWPQIISLFVIVISFLIIIFYPHVQKKRQ